LAPHVQRFAEVCNIFKSLRDPKRSKLKLKISTQQNKDRNYPKNSCIKTICEVPIKKFNKSNPLGVLQRTKTRNLPKMNHSIMSYRDFSMIFLLAASQQRVENNNSLIFSIFCIQMGKALHFIFKKKQRHKLKIYIKQKIKNKNSRVASHKVLYL
jgi:hypothetical protein